MRAGTREFSGLLEKFDGGMDYGEWIERDGGYFFSRFIYFLFITLLFSYCVVVVILFSSMGCNGAIKGWRRMLGFGHGMDGWDGIRNFLVDDEF